MVRQSCGGLWGVFPKPVLALDHFANIYVQEEEKGKRLALVC